MCLIGKLQNKINYVLLNGWQNAIHFFVQYAKLTNDNFCDTISIQIKGKWQVYLTILKDFLFLKLEVSCMKKYIIGALLTVTATALTPIQVYAVESIEQIAQFLANIF